MVTNIQAMVKIILANQEKNQQNQQLHDHPNHFIQFKPTPSAFHILAPPENYSPRYTEGETVRRTGLVRWPQEDHEDGKKQRENHGQNSLVRWEDFVTRADDLNSKDSAGFITNKGDEANSNSDIDYHINTGVAQEKDHDYVVSEGGYNFIGPEVLIQEAPLRINKFFK